MFLRIYGAWLGHLSPSGTESTTATAEERWLFWATVLLLSDDDLTDNPVYVVVRGNLWFEAALVIDAVDVCLKTAYVFGLVYTMVSRSSWTFVQKWLHSSKDFLSTRLA